MCAKLEKLQADCSGWHCHCWVATGKKCLNTSKLHCSEALQASEADLTQIPLKDEEECQKNKAASLASLLGFVMAGAEV